VTEAHRDVDIDTTPDELAYEGYRNYTYNLWSALGEFIDNSITSAYQNWGDLVKVHGVAYKLVIEITLDPQTKTLEVLDNAAGISIQRFSDVLVAGRRPQDPSFLSVHGMGMKLASFWWGRSLTITSSPIGMDYTTKAVMDLDVMKANGNANAQARVLKRVSDHPGTLIQLSKTYGNRWPDTKALNSLSLLIRSMYRGFTNASERPVEIILNGTKLNFEPFPLLEAPFWPNTKGPGAGTTPKYWRKDFQMTTSTGRYISGWYGILRQIKRDLSGFFLHYKGKGMEGIGYADSNSSEEISLASVREAKQYYRPAQIFGQDGSYRFGRFTGEFDISEFGKTSSTDAVGWSRDEEQEFIDALLGDMKASPESFWTMADSYQPRTAKRLEKEREDTDVTQKEARDISDIFFKGWTGDDLFHESDTSETSSIEELKLSSLDSADLVSLEFVTIRDASNHEHEIALEIASDPDLGLYSFNQSSNPDGHHHILRLNAGHPLLRKLQWGNRFVRESALTLTLLMALPEIFLRPRVLRSDFKHKINEIAGLLATSKTDQDE
jgi:hypothetical protein